MSVIFEHIGSHLGLDNSSTADNLESVFNKYHESLMPKLGNFLGHVCEFAHYDRLIQQGIKVVKHPNGQRMAPDLQIVFQNKTYWIEDKNCSAGSYGKITNNCVPLRNYKHSYRNVKDSGTKDLYYAFPDENDKEYILAVCTHPLTKKLEWKYAFFKDLPEHPKHPGRIASNLKVPLEPDADDIWENSLIDLLKRKV
tara:strand:+ start:127 stop:717 length:591 start_codon:yes stop_codon:yes gene_type:complete